MRETRRDPRRSRDSSSVRSRPATPSRERRTSAGRAPARAARPTAQGHSLTFTSRAAVLGLTLCAVVLMLAYPTKGYLAQRSSIDAAQRQRATLQAQIDALTKEHAAATDPAQIEAQARARLHYTVPGTRNYIQVQPPEAAAKTTTKAGNASVPTNPTGSWYGTLYGSDQTAGR